MVKDSNSDPSELLEGVAFSQLPRIGCRAFRVGVERHGSASAAFRAAKNVPAADREAALATARAQLEAARSRGVTVLLQGEPAYPPPLLDLDDPPCFLFALGDDRLLERRRVGIVGTRHASASGERIARQMATRLVDAGIVVVSGMAFGIDAAAHRGALDAGGGTIAVLGGGVDLPYPPSHAALHESIGRHGLVLAEAPMGTRPVPGAFPKRNRIIAALTETLIVIEAGDRSGALITSRVALELGRNVGAVPGPIDSPRHVGSNRLLADGAAFIGTVDDVLSLAGVSSQPVTEQESVPTRDAEDDPNRRSILDAVRGGVTDIEHLARRTRLAPRDFANPLALLEVTGRLRVTDGGTVALSASP